MSNVPRCPRLVALLVGLGWVASELGCAKVTPGADGAGGGGGRTSTGTGGMFVRRDAGSGLGGTPADIDASVDAGPPITDFPGDPVLGTATTPANAPTLFGGAPRSGSAPCVLSPQDGTLMPKNWLRPRFEWRRASDENLFEIRLEVARFATPLRIYTDDLAAYKLDRGLWDDIRRSVLDEPITVSIRAMTVSGTGTAQQGPSAPAQVSFTIAPVDAPGKIVYWSLTGDGNLGMGSLKGFGIGEEGVRDVLVPAQVANRTANDGCIGCHSATPGGDSVQFVFGPPASKIGLDTYFNNVSDIQTGTEGTLPSYVSQPAITLIQTLRGIPAFSIGHWVDQDRIVLLTDANNHGDLLWVQLDAAASPMSGTIARTGDAQGAVEPAFSHDGRTVVYVSTPITLDSIHDGRLANGPADLYSVPYNARAGGAAVKLAGASDPSFTEYYPAFSANDDLVAYTRIPGTGLSYNNPGAELFVVPSGGGTALRLPANDPPACLFRTSPGITNDWSKWAPQANRASNGKTYNWLVFSSTRSGKAQLYVSAVVTDGSGPPQTFPALYLWNQPPAEGNHTPSWDNYRIPPVVIIP